MKLKSKQPETQRPIFLRNRTVDIPDAESSKAIHRKLARSCADVLALQAPPAEGSAKPYTLPHLARTEDAEYTLGPAYDQWGNRVDWRCAESACKHERCALTTIDRERSFLALSGGHEKGLNDEQEDEIERDLSSDDEGDLGDDDGSRPHEPSPRTPPQLELYAAATNPGAFSPEFRSDVRVDPRPEADTCSPWDTGSPLTSLPSSAASSRAPSPKP